MALPVYTRYIVVDDTSLDIKYGGDSWFAIEQSHIPSSTILRGTWGVPYAFTLHGTNSSASFNFNFSGPAVRAVGSNPIQNNSSATISDLQWSCSVDGVSINSTLPSRDQYPGNNWEFCSSNTLTDGPHMMTVNATVTNNQTFWFDRIEYAPSSSVSLQNKSILLTWEDPGIQYGNGWNHSSTDRNNSTFVLNFIGTSLTWYGNVYGGTSTTSLWTIDDNPTKIFTLPAIANITFVDRYMKIFETEQYPMGWHKLQVIYYSPDNASVPLLLHYLIVQNGSLLDSSSLAGPTSTTWSSSSSPTSNRSTSTNKGIIIGGGVGGAACLLIAFLVLLFIYRCRRHAEDRMVEVGVPFIVEESPLSHNAIPPQGKEPAVFNSLRRAPHQEEQPLAQNHSSNPEIRISNFDSGQVVGPSGFTVGRGSGVYLTNQEIPGSMEDLPPAYSPG